MGHSPAPREAEACPRRGSPGTPQLPGGRDQAGPQVVLGLVSPRGRMTAFRRRGQATRHGVRVAGGPARPEMRALPWPGRSRRSQRALDGAAGPGAHCFWLRWELSEHKLQEAQRCVGATCSGVPDVFTLVGTWSPPALSQSIQGQGFRRRSQHPQIKRRPRQTAGRPPKVTAMPGGEGACARKDGRHGMAAWPGRGAFPSLARCSQRAFAFPLCIL